MFYSWRYFLIIGEIKYNCLAISRHFRFSWWGGLVIPSREQTGLYWDGGLKPARTCHFHPPALPPNVLAGFEIKSYLILGNWLSHDFTQAVKKNTQNISYYSEDCLDGTGGEHHFDSLLIYWELRGRPVGCLTCCLLLRKLFVCLRLIMFTFCLWGIIKFTFH